MVAKEKVHPKMITELTYFARYPVCGIRLSVVSLFDI